MAPPPSLWSSEYNQETKGIRKVMSRITPSSIRKSRSEDMPSARAEGACH